jgi:hypothetical protein
LNARGLSLLAAALLATVALELQQTPTEDALASGTAGMPRALLSGNLDDAPADLQGKEAAESLVGTILARPLFAPSRRLPAGATAAGEGLPRLAGVIIGPDIRSAIFAPVNGSSFVINEGGRTGAYEVDSIGPDEVVISGPDGERRLHIDFAKPLPIKPQIIQGRNPAAAGQN